MGKNKKATKTGIKNKILSVYDPVANRVNDYFRFFYDKTRRSYFLALQNTEKAAASIKVRLYGLKAELGSYAGSLAARTGGFKSKIVRTYWKVMAAPVVEKIKSSAVKVPVFFKRIPAELKRLSAAFMLILKKARFPEKKPLKKVKKEVRAEPGKKRLTLRRGLSFALVGLFSIFVILAVIFGVRIYQLYQESFSKTREILEAQKQYDAGNFDKPEFNYIEVLSDREVRPGQAIDLRIYFKNTGMLAANDLKIGITIPENIEIIEQVIKTYDHDFKDSMILVSLGDVPPGEGDVLSIGFKVKSPLKDGTEINIPDLKYFYVKEAPLIGKKNLFNQDITSDENLTVVASPDFGQSGIIIEGQDAAGGEQGLETLTCGDEILYRIEIVNSGDMDAEDVDITVGHLDNLIARPEDNPDFQINNGEASMSIDNFKAGDEKTFKLLAYVDEGSENDSVILPVLNIEWGDISSELEAPERIVKLYPAFDSSRIAMAARGTGGVYSGDVIDVTVSVKNSGDIEAKNVIAELVLSNLFSLDQGETTWNIEKLSEGEIVTFQTSLKITGDITEDTYGSCSLKVSSDGMSGTRVAEASVFISGERPFTGNYIPIVALHGVEPNPSGRYEISTGQFDALCATLKAAGYKTITLMDMLGYVQGSKQLPEKPVIITSDDGYQNMYTHAFPILQKYGYKMTVFLVTGLMGNAEGDRHINEWDAGRSVPVRPMLIWPEVVAMSRYGIEFQSHTVNHRSVGELSGDDAYFEMAQSKADIEAHTGRPCVFIAWPHGSYNGSILSMLPGIGYRGALMYGGGIENVSSLNIYELKRIPFYGPIPASSYADMMGLY